MTVSLTHSTPADGTFSATGATAWDAEHVLTQATNALLGRATAGTGATEEISVGTGLSLSGGTLTNTVTATSPGGSATQIQYNNAGAFAGASGITTTGTELALSSGTKTASAPVLDMSQTWNNAAVTFTGLKLNVTDTASAAASLLMDLQVGGTSKFKVEKSGQSTFTNYVISTTGFYAPASGNCTFIVNNAGGGVVIAGATNYFGFAATNAFLGADLFLTRRAAANLRLGAADAAAPVAQTLSVQSAAAGNSNVSGANLTITGSQSTGSGNAGSILFQTASAGSSGTAQNALATVATIGPNTLSGSQTTPVLDLAQTWNTSGVATGLKLNVTDTTSASASLLMDLQVGASSKLTVLKNGQLSISPGSGATNDMGYSWVGRLVGISSPATDQIRIGRANSYDMLWDLGSSSKRIILRSAFSFGWTSSSADGAFDTILTRKAAANLQLGNVDAAAPVAQTLSVQSVVAGTSNTAGANLTITGSQGTGTGAGGSILFQVAPAGSSGTAQNSLVTALTLTSNSALTLANTQNTTTSADNCLLTLSSTNRAAAVILASASSTTASVVFQNASTERGRITYSNVSEFMSFQVNGTTEALRITSAGLLTFGGVTSSFPAIKRSTTSLQARLADDSAFATIQGKLRADVNAVAETPTATHTITITDAAGTAYKVLCVAA